MTALVTLAALAAALLVYLLVRWADQFASTAVPGFSDATTTTERAFVLGPAGSYLLKGIMIKGSAASDAGNTPTTELRAGLLMGKRTADGFYAHYAPNATDGTQFAEGPLWLSRRTIDTDGNTVDRQGQIVISGYVKASQILLLDQQARAQMYHRFYFDDDLIGNSMGWRQVVAKTANYTVTAADNNTIFTNQGAAGAVTFTLPTIAKGLRYRFFGEAAQNVIVASVVTDTLVVFNDLAADSIALQTAGEIIGSGFEVIANADATKWLVFVFLGAETATPTIAT
jgi:hypothetical protein